MADTVTSILLKKVERDNARYRQLQTDQKRLWDQYHHHERQMQVIYRQIQATNEQLRNLQNEVTKIIQREERTNK